MKTLMMKMLMMINIEKIGSVRRLFKKFNRNYYKPTVVNRGFAGEVNNYIKYRSEGDKDEKLSPEEYLNMIRPDLRDLINKHKPIEELNNNNNDSNNNNDNNNDSDNDDNDTDNNDTDRGEWEIQVSIIIVVFLLKVLTKNEPCTQKVKQ